ARRRLLQLVEARRDEADVFASSHEAEIAGSPERRLGLRSIADAASRDKQSQIVAGPTRLTVAAVGRFPLAELVARVAAPIVASLLPERQVIALAGVTELISRHQRDEHQGPDRHIREVPATRRKTTDKCERIDPACRSRSGHAIDEPNGEVQKQYREQLVVEPECGCQRDD